MIPLQKPFITGDEIEFIKDAIQEVQLSGNGKYTRKCQLFFEEKYNINKCLLTNSCTSALEMAALLLNVAPGDEIIVPSFTYVSTANPFVMRGANLIFADSEFDTPNIDASKLPTLITEKTKAIVVVHYAGIACDMDAIMALAKAHNIFVLEDAAHAQGATYKNSFLGTIGHLGMYSFHATKNITSGEGGLLLINDSQFIARAEMLWEKGTNRANFLKGEVHQYEWCDVGSSFYPSEITAAFLWAQLKHIDNVNKRRLIYWNIYAKNLSTIPGVEVPKIPDYATHNAHLFYLKVATKALRDQLIIALKAHGIKSAFHYMALHQSPFWSIHPSSSLPNAEMWEDQIIRLPLYFDLSKSQVMFVIETIHQLMNKV